MAVNNTNAGIKKQEVFEENPNASEKEDYFLQVAQHAYTSSTDFFEANYYRQIEKNISMFRSKHPTGSKYYTDQYKHRSKVFRPKTRAAIRRNEAAAAMAFFSTEDDVNISAEDDTDPAGRIVAELASELVNYRLGVNNPKSSIPWFLTLVGAYQDAQVQGAVVSHQHWEYEEKEEEQEVPHMIDPETGEPFTIKQMMPVVDRPCIDLVPLENIRFDPAAKWFDPINTSPYLIHVIPMYVVDVLERMEREDPKTGQPEWTPLTTGEILSARTDRYDTLRYQRQGPGRQDPTVQSDPIIPDHEIVFIHQNFLKRNGEDIVYYTLGTSFRLTDPKPVKEVYKHCKDGARPFTYGFCVIETHRLMPSGLPELGEGPQIASNEIQNQRIDNVRLALNKRYKIRRGGNVDINALKRSVPGGSVVMNDPNGDVVEFQYQDVTGSSFQEQDRLNVDFDEILGTFSAGTMQSNKNPGAAQNTLGGLSMMSMDANQVSEYALRTFTETWVQPTLTQLVKMEQEYETDPEVLAIAGKKSRLWRQFQKEFQPTEPMGNAHLQRPVQLKVNVGFGSTNPMGKVQKLALGFSSAAQIVPQAMARVQDEEVIKEIFGALGFTDGARFFTSKEQEEENPEVSRLRQQLQQLGSMLESKVADEKAKAAAQMEVEKAKAETEIKLKQMDHVHNMAIEDKKAEQARQENALRAQPTAVQPENNQWRKDVVVQQEDTKLRIAADKSALEQQKLHLEREKIRQQDSEETKNKIIEWIRKNGSEEAKKMLDRL